MDLLSFYDIDTATAVTALDGGTVASSSSDDTGLRVLNNSDLYQAQDVTVSLAGSAAVQLWLSTDGDTFTPSIGLGDIPPGGTSPVFWLRRVTSADVGDGPCTAALIAAASGWSDPIDTSASSNVPLSTED